MSRFTEAEYYFTGRTVETSGLAEVELLTDLTYEIDHLGSGLIVHAPKGFRCDLASIRPWMLNFKLGRYVAEKLSRASIPHDVLRRDRKKSKFLGDYVFWEAMGVDKVPIWLRILAITFVLFNFSRN